MGRPLFANSDFLRAARALAAAHGPAAVTVGSVTAHLKSPTGSFYHRFASRDVLLGELWLATARNFQEGFVAAIERGDGLAAALHTPNWVRAHLDDARLFLLYHRDDFVHGEWPRSLREGVAEQGARIDRCYERFARESFGTAGLSAVRRARFILADVPIAAVSPHLRRRERPPALVDELICQTYHAIVASNRPSRRRKAAER
jgi:AcrR family transcriptional regulator